jgi:hypothetical protein
LTVRDMLLHLRQARRIAEAEEQAAAEAMRGSEG